MAIILDEAGADLLDEAGGFILDETPLPPFPDTALDLRVEINVNGWTDVSAYNDHGPVTIGRGHPDESTTVSPSTLALTLTNDSTGRFSTKSPASAYYPHLVRNTPGRVSIPAQSNYLRMEGGDLASYASCPDSVPLEITGSLDVRVDCQPSGIGGNGVVLAAKTSSSALSWALVLLDGGFPVLYWTPDGTSLASVTATAAVPARGRFAVRASLDASLGEVTFYTAATMAGSWTQLGGITSGTHFSPATVYSAAVPLYTGGWPQPLGLSAGSFTGRIFEMQLYSGLAVTLVADPVFSAQSAGTTSFSDGHSNTWTLSSNAEISSRDYRAHAELAGWPQNQDQSGKTVLVNVSGGGLLRRKGRQNNPLPSAMTRYYQKAATGVAAWWPMEDGSGATQIASGLASGLPMALSGTPQLASDSSFACSAPLPVLNAAILTGLVTGDAASEEGTSNVIFLLKIPAAGDTNLSTVCTVLTDNQPDTVKLVYTTAANGTLTVTGYFVGSTVFTGTVATGVNGQNLAVQLTLQQISIIGGTCAYGAAVLKPGSSSPAGTSGTYSGATGRVTSVIFNGDGLLTGTVAGQCAVLSGTYSSITAALAALNGYLCPDGSAAGPLNAWAGEPAGIRIGRLCSEEGIQFRGTGWMYQTQQMGVQGLQTLAALAQECADADRGVWYEPRQVLGWGYVARSALYNQAAQVTVDYGQDHLSMWASDPTEDDQFTLNDVTVQSSTKGSSARAFAAPGQPVTGGRLSVQPPPAGAGTYDTQLSVNTYQDSQLASLATWAVYLGTADEPRYPGIVLDLANRDLSSLFWNVLGLDLGQRVTIANPPGWLPPDPVSQLAAQLQEVLWTKQLEITVCGIPERPYEVAVVGTAHLDTDGTTLNAGVSSGATSESFATAGSFPLWSVSGGDYPCDVMVAGERQTVTAMSGGGSPQAATVTRSVNGVSKAQASGAVVTVYPPPVIAL